MFKRLRLRIIYYLIALSSLTFIVIIFLSLPNENPEWVLNTYILLWIVTLNYLFFLIERKRNYPIKGLLESEKIEKINNFYPIKGLLESKAIKRISKIILIILIILMVLFNIYISMIIFIFSLLIILARVSNKIIAIFNFIFQTRFLAADIEKMYQTNVSIIEEMAELDEIISNFKNEIYIELEKNTYDLMYKEDFEKLVWKLGKSVSTNKSIIKQYEKKVLDRNTLEDKKAEVIKFRNNYNLIYAFLVAVILLVAKITQISIDMDFLELFSIIIMDEINPIPKKIIYVFVMFLLIEMIQRGIEIGKAFYFDIIEIQPKTSSLSSSDRLTLAVKSMAEITLISLSLKLILLNFPDIKSVINAILQTISIGLFNVSYPDNKIEAGINYNDLVISITHFSQVLIAILLVTMAIAKYLSGNKNVYEFDIKFNENTSRYELYRCINNPYKTKPTLLMDGFTFKELELISEHLLYANRLNAEEYASIQTYLYRYCYKEKRKI